MIEVGDIRKHFGSVEVLRGVSFDVGEGQIVAIVGPSGSGKTTLLQIMGSLMGADNGTVRYDGTDITSLNGDELSGWRNRNVGFVFQFHQLLPEFTLQENVALPALIGGMKRKEAMERAGELIAELGLTGRAGHRPGQLSGGECQRAAVARALINSPKVILADEPSGSLDSGNRRELHELFFRLREERGQTFVIVTHDEGLAGQCDRTLHLADGKIVRVDE